MAALTEKIADGVWRHAGDLRRGMNVYFLEDGDGITMFDAGTSRMVNSIRQALEGIGPLRRILLGHAHADHRGAAPGLGVPVLCHEAERAYAEGDGGLGYFHLDRVEVWWSRLLYPYLLRLWDGGPVRIADVVSEGDEIAGFRVLHFPGHAPGLIGLWRESDRLALVSDVIYMVDSMRLRLLAEGEAPVVPHRAFNWDHEAARESIRHLAGRGAETVWAGHAEALTGSAEEVRARLERAAERG